MIDKLFISILSILITIQIVLIILKVIGCITISWIYTLLPLIITVSIIVSLVVVLIFCVWRNVR